MAYVVVDNFSAGLDSRRHPLTSRPGTLQSIVNAHISRGGEIEKRKAFVQLEDLSVFGVSTYGLEAASDTIYVFGSEVVYGGPFNGITYQRLQHPEGKPMVGVVYSTLYGGKPFVLAEFLTVGDEPREILPFWDGKLVRDFTSGVSFSGDSMTTLAAHIAADINADNTDYGTGYTATSSGPVITLIGPPGVKFTPSATADSPLSVATATTVASDSSVTEVVATGSFAVTAGSQTAASARRNVRYLDVTALPGITSVRVGASAVNVPDGQDILGAGSPVFYNTINPMPVPYGGEPERILYVLKEYINAGTGTHGYTATWKYFPGWAGNDPAELAIIANPGIGSDANGRIVQIEFAGNPTGVASIAELIDTATIAVSPYNPARWIATWSTLAGGSTNSVTSVKVDGVEVMGSETKWNTSHSQTMQDVVAKINSYASTPEYTAVFENNKVVIKAAAGTGASPNGKVVAVTVSGNVAIGSVSNLAGGVTARSAVSQQSTFTISGGGFALERGLKVSLVATPELDPTGAVYFGATRVANSIPIAALTFKTKEHIASKSTLFFSGVNQPTRWGDNGVGAGFINLSNNNGGNEVLTGLALYQGQLAAFARRSIQLWTIDTDPANNRQGQVINNTGALSASSIVSVGELDVFYLSDSGVRSVRARDASNAAVVNDVGTPVDSLILAALADMTDDQKASCPAVIEPIDGRYWIGIGNKIYVFSYFPNSQVAAWSVYDPGFVPQKFVTKDGRIFVRSSQNKVYVYGGESGLEYDSSQVEVTLPFLDGGKPAHKKTLMGLDMTVQGDWAAYVGTDPVSPDARDQCGVITQPTFSLGRVMASGQGTHFGLRFVCNSSGYAGIANVIAHYEMNDAD